MTARKVRVRQAFWEDLQEQAAWYDEQTPGTGRQLEGEVELYLDKISQRPQTFRALKGTIHRALLPRFEHYIVYDLAPDRVFVLGLVHAARDFDRWLNRRLDEEE